MNRKILSCIWLVLSGIILSSCSNQKNTPATRGYHNLTAHYNVLFNGQESYKKGMRKLEAAYKDNYSKILPVFTYENNDIAKSIGFEMDIAIKKAAKLIMLHSIKAKPKFKKGHVMTLKEKEFYNKNEFNKWVNVAYLMIGKANFYKHAYTTANDAFLFTVRQFPKEDAQYISQIWIARINCEKGEYKEADMMLTALQADIDFPKKFKFDLYATMADAAIKQNMYETGIKDLELAIPLVPDRITKLRFLYIMAQLYQQTGKMKQAADMFHHIIRMLPTMK